VDEVTQFGTIVLVVALGFSVALVAAKLADYLPVPAPAIFLVAAAVASDLSPGLGTYLSIQTVERIAVVALIVILFGGGYEIGLRRFRQAAVPIAVLGVLGTFATAGAVALFAHYALGFAWIASGLIGAAIAPTDPAVMFSVLGDREIAGRTGTILEGESGANDPVGIALMIGMVDLALHPGGSFWIVGREFAIEMAVGLAIGIAGGILQTWLLRRVVLPNPGLNAVRTLAGAGVIYGVASVAHGSGFLAVFVAGLIVGVAKAPLKREIENFQTALSSIAEIVVFVALGLTITLGSVSGSDWRQGLALVAFLALVARPAAVGALLVPVRLRLGERLFVAWGGLKGAVPILLAAFALLAGVDEGERIYDIVFVVVLLSVVVQGSSIPFAAERLGVPMRRIRHTEEPEEPPRTRVT
jgi:cell volume regulation protein A